MMNILKQIFSITNVNLYKVVTIMGIKIKFLNIKKAIKTISKQKNNPIFYAS